MTQKISILTLSVLASASIAAERFVTAAGGVASAAGNAIGVSCTQAAAGEIFPVDVIGTAVVTAGGAFDKGAWLEIGSDGKAVVQTTGPAVAWAQQAATADGDRVSVVLIPNAPAAG
jgi:hypothetical protein